MGKGGSAARARIGSNAPRCDAGSGSIGARTALISAAMIAGAGHAAAQTAADPPLTTNVSEIVITALKRDTMVQTTPISDTALTRKATTASGVEDSYGLASVPGVAIVKEGASNTRVVIRGV